MSAPALEEGRAEVVAADDPGARRLVACGRTWLNEEICIVDPDTGAARQAGRVGEIWVQGPSVAQGYWGKPEETELAFKAYRSDNGAGPYLRTGDLGFLLDGELFVTGRIKDLIIIHGRNHYPQDIEATVQAVHVGLRPECGAAFEVNRDGQSRLVVVQEVDRRSRRLDVGQLLGDVREALARQHDLQLFDLLLIDNGAIPKTSSGKVRRHKCRQDYENGALRPWKGGA